MGLGWAAVVCEDVELKINRNRCGADQSWIIEPSQGKIARIGDANQVVAAGHFGRDIKPGIRSRGGGVSGYDGAPELDSAVATEAAAEATDTAARTKRQVTRNR